MDPVKTTQAVAPWAAIAISIYTLMVTWLRARRERRERDLDRLSVFAEPGPDLATYLVRVEYRPPGRHTTYGFRVFPRGNGVRLYGALRQVTRDSLGGETVEWQVMEPGSDGMLGPETAWNWKGDTVVGRLFARAQHPRKPIEVVVLDHGRWRPVIKQRFWLFVG